MPLVNIRAVQVSAVGPGPPMAGPNRPWRNRYPPAVDRGGRSTDIRNIMTLTLGDNPQNRRSIWLLCAMPRVPLIAAAGRRPVADAAHQQPFGLVPPNGSVVMVALEDVVETWLAPCATDVPLTDAGEAAHENEPRLCQPAHG